MYDRVYKQSICGDVKQYFDDLDGVIEDQEEAMRINDFLGANNYGKDKQNILNKNPHNQSITEQDMKKFSRAFVR